MDNLKYCRPSDIITSLATITASGSISTDPEYGLASLYDRNPAKPLKFLTAGPVRLVYDFGATRRIDAFSLPNHNLDAGLDCIVSLNATNNWTSPTVSVAMEVGTEHLDGHRASPWADFTTASGYTASGFRYCSLFIPANTSAIKLGETPIISNLREFSQWTQFGGERGATKPFLESIRTEFGVVRVYRRRVKQRYFRYQIKGTDDTTKQVAASALARDDDFNALQDLSDDAGGMALPFFVTANSAIKTDGGLYARFTKETAERTSAQEEWFDISPFRFEVEEVSRSLPL